MPTGYTAKIYNGEEVNFKSFAMQCARAFGANVMMRDEPMDAEIKEYKVSPYHNEALEQSEKELEDMQDWTEEQILVYNENTHTKEMESYNKRVKEIESLKIRYDGMLQQALAWIPPTKDHLQLKEFMIDQLEKSIEFDCSHHISVPTRRNYYADKIKNLVWYVEYHKDELQKEIDRTNERNRWNRALRESLDALK